MPTYQYACTECAEQLEVVQRFSDEPLTVCSSCGGRLRKVFSPVGIVFKGSGFYRTDSRKGPDHSKPANGSKPDSGEKSTADGSGSSGDKPADKKSSDKASTPASSASSSSSSSSGSSSSSSSSSSGSSSPGSSTGSKVA